MANLEGTKTLQNLMNSFAGESQARNRYNMYANIARKDGYQQIANIFEETAENERVHAKTFYKFIVKTLSLAEPKMFNVQADYPVSLGDTLQNLKAAAAGENEEHTKLYPEAADTADEEGFPEIAQKFRSIAKVELAHDKRYTKLAENIEKGSVFKKENTVTWKCLKCGYVHEGDSAPEKCPSCDHPQAYFEVQNQNY